MHKSQLAGLIIDCQTDDLDAAATFWSAALGLEIKSDPRIDESIYRPLGTQPDDLYLEVQKVSHDSRVHIDIESDDIEAEARRLEGLGARRIGKVKGWIVMEAPTGQRFCIVKPCRSNFDRDANTWD